MLIQFFKLEKVRLILTCVLFSLSIAAVNGQVSLGSITTASTSCNISFPVCEGDTVRLAPSNTSGFTNFQWYHTSVTVANEINAQDLSVGAYEVSNDTLYVIIPGGTYILTGEYATPGGCATLNDTITLDFQTPPDLSTTDIDLCVGNGETADLSTLVTDNNSIVGTTLWFTTLSGAQMNTGAISNTVVSPASTITYYVRKTSSATAGCYDIDSTLVTVNPMPTASTTSLTQCETVSAGGTSVFLLSGATTTALNGQTGMTVTYHTTQANADSGAAPITTSTATDGTIVYVRIENSDGCYATAEITLNVDPLPTATNASLTECESAVGGGEFDFTLSNANSDVLNGQPSTLSVSYHETQMDADNGTNSISNLTASNGDIVYVRVENSDGCFATAQITLNVNVRPAFALSVPTTCPGDNPTILIVPGTGADANPSVSVNGGANFSFSSLVTTGIVTTNEDLLVGANNLIRLTNSTGCDAAQTILTPGFISKVCLPVTIEVFKKNP